MTTGPVTAVSEGGVPRPAGSLTSGLLRPFLGYALAAAAVTGLAALSLATFVWPDHITAVKVVAVLAYFIQLIAFAALLPARKAADRFLLAWVGGTALRLGAVAAVAVWLLRTGTEPMKPWLLGLVGILFLLMIMEPLFLRGAFRGT